MGEEASAVLKKALADAFLNSNESLATGSPSNPNQKVNDLTKMVKKKKVENPNLVVEAGGSGSVVDGKRKAEEPIKAGGSGSGSGECKKARVEDFNE